jgi:protein involved in ribonucleotide reduction
VKFLNREANRRLLRGVIGAGNTNFGSTFGLAADRIAAKCDVPVLYKFELMGTPEDVRKVNQGLEQFWRQFPQLRA